MNQVYSTYQRAIARAQEAGIRETGELMLMGQLMAAQEDARLSREEFQSLMLFFSKDYRRLYADDFGLARVAGADEN